ncbi:MAG: hypothetical protein B7X04_04450 [Parcubacteria group bacterium 21-54-25]|nr:MAG: hypothetical protein B7X04_04450 [Parcubacteria group bacterium 21-54-25]
MSNITTKGANLPTTLNPSALMMDAMAGMSGEGRMFPEISIKASRWRLRPVGDEDETVLNTFNIQFALVSANPAKSKTFYLQKYDPEGEPKAPDCFSDDGIRPAADAQAKQSDLCATCEHNVWGSDMNPQTGKKNKRCKDSKRISVMLIGNESELYAWRLAPMNMLSFVDALKDAARQGVDIERVAFEAAFDTKSTFPHVLFKIARPLTNDEYEAVATLRASEGAKAAIGMGGTVVQAKPVERVKVEAIPAPEVKAKPQVVAKPKAVAAESVDLDSLLDGTA